MVKKDNLARILLFTALVLSLYFTTSRSTLWLREFKLSILLSFTSLLQLFAYPKSVFTIYFYPAEPHSSVGSVADMRTGGRWFYPQLHLSSLPRSLSPPTLSTCNQPLLQPPLPHPQSPILSLPQLLSPFLSLYSFPTPKALYILSCLLSQPRFLGCAVWQNAWGRIHGVCFYSWQMT